MKSLFTKPETFNHNLKYLKLIYIYSIGKCE